MDLSIIIVNYNLSEEIANCLDSLLKLDISDNTFSFEVIIVDNDSPDKKLKLVEEKNNYEHIKFYYLDNNVGFGKGCNYGFTKASGKYICFLNPDTLVKTNLFNKVIELFEKDSSIGIIGPKQQLQKPFFDFSAGYSPKVFFEIVNLFGIGIFVEGIIMFSQSSILKRSPIYVNWILGACIFMKASLFEKVNGFDPDYFMFFEELDLCKRVKDSGHKIIYIPELSIHHIGSVSGKKNYFLYTVRTYASKYIYINKHYKFLFKNIFKALLYLQLFSQIIIWSILALKNKEKGTEKIKAFIYLLKNGFKNKIDKQIV